MSYLEYSHQKLIMGIMAFAIGFLMFSNITAIQIMGLLGEELEMSKAWICYWQLEANPDTNSCIVSYRDVPPENRFYP